MVIFALLCLLIGTWSHSSDYKIKVGSYEHFMIRLDLLPFNEMCELELGAAFINFMTFDLLMKDKDSGPLIILCIKWNLYKLLRAVLGMHFFHSSSFWLKVAFDLLFNFLCLAHQLLAVVRGIKNKASELKQQLNIKPGALACVLCVGEMFLISPCACTAVLLFDFET